MLKVIRKFNQSRLPGLSKFEAQRLFTDSEAWFLFRLAAFGEAVGWTLLISGLAVQKFVMHGNPAAVQMAGTVHGTLFLFYAGIAFATYPSLGWSRLRALVALTCSVPPFGTLVFERIVSVARGYNSANRLFTFQVYTWYLPVSDPASTV